MSRRYQSSAESFWIFCFEVILIIIVWALIELLDGIFEWGLAGWLSLLIAAVLVFGGWLVIVHGDDIDWLD